MASMTMQQAAADFLAQKRIAVAGVSRSTGGEHGGNVVYKRLRERGYEVFAVNPNADEVEGDPCYHDLSSVPDGVDAVVIATHPDQAETVMNECAELGITRVWMHRSFGTGSVSETAAELGRRQGLTVIAGGCPLMYPPTSDFGHRAMRWMLNLSGRIPKQA